MNILEKKDLKASPVTTVHGTIVLQFLVSIYRSKLSNTNFIQHFPVEYLQYKNTAKTKVYEL